MSRSKDIAEILGVTEAANTGNISLGAGVGQPGGGLDSSATTDLIDTTYINERIENSIQFNQDGTLAITTGTARWYAPKALTISRICGKLATASNGAVGVSVKKNGTQINTFNIGASSVNNDQTSLSLSVAEGDYLTIDITSVGSTPGSDLSVKIYYS